ncbi:hypothetical protein [Frigidibacter sp. ROC022]|nr:hypothetical protein [Frigidibacter sp. ROC022]MCR8726262.1 hypothetical protein [Frigidibacter sp. ROC022]
MAKKRWMESVLKASAETKVTMPWARGTNRLHMIARRNKELAKAKLAEA